MDLTGAKALVTGGSTGIGKGIAAALKREGADVTITARQRQRLDRRQFQLQNRVLRRVPVDADQPLRVLAQEIQRIAAGGRNRDDRVVRR